MDRTCRKTAVQAAPLPVQNLTFSDYTGIAPKGYFGGNGFSNNSYYVNPVDWSRGPTINDDLVFIDAPGTANQYGAGPNSYSVYPTSRSYGMDTKLPASLGGQLAFPFSSQAEPTARSEPVAAER